MLLEVLPLIACQPVGKVQVYEVAPLTGGTEYVTGAVRLQTATAGPVMGPGWGIERVTGKGALHSEKRRLLGLQVFMPRTRILPPVQALG